MHKDHIKILDDIAFLFRQVMTQSSSNQSKNSPKLWFGKVLDSSSQQTIIISNKTRKPLVFPAEILQVRVNELQISPYRVLDCKPGLHKRGPGRNGGEKLGNAGCPHVQKSTSERK